MTSYESHLALQVERWDHDHCDECGNRMHRADLNDGLCPQCVEYMEEEGL